MKLVSTLQTHEITDHKLQKTKLFRLYYMHYCMSHFHTDKRKPNILYKHSQNKQLLIYILHAFLFLLLYFHTIRRFSFPKNTMQIIFAKLFNILNNAI